MSFLHSRCESLEATLRARCSDLESEVDRLREELNRQYEKSNDREREVMDRLLAVTHPNALMAARVSTPAPPPPSLDRQQARRFPSAARIATAGRNASPILQPPKTDPSPAPLPNE